MDPLCCFLCYKGCGGRCCLIHSNSKLYIYICDMYVCIYTYVYIWCDIVYIVSIVYNIEYMMVYIYICTYLPLVSIGLVYQLQTDYSKKTHHFCARLGNAIIPTNFKLVSSDIPMIFSSVQVKFWYVLLIFLVITNWFINHEISKLCEYITIFSCW